MHKTTVFLPDDIWRGLDGASRDTGRSKSELIREALRAYLADRGRSWPQTLGRHRSGGVFAARDDEEILTTRWRE